MAKLSSIAKNAKRKKLSELKAPMREALRKVIKTDPENRDVAILKLNKRPRNESKHRVRNRCEQCGRPNGTLRKFGLCRICLRNTAMKGLVPGLRKASW